MDRVSFYKTVSTGQELVCVVEFDGEKVTCRGPEVYAKTLFPGHDERPASEIMKEAPQRFDGHYLRAKYETIDSKGFVTLEDGRVIFIEGPGGGTGGASNFADAATSTRISSSRELGEGGVNNASLIKYKDDGAGVWKGPYMDEASAEVAAYRINRLLGGNEVPETVYAENEEGVMGSSQLYIEDADIAFVAKNVGMEKGAPKESYDQIIALDLIIQNADRHFGNYMFKGTESKSILIAIDHGYCHMDRVAPIGADGISLKIPSYHYLSRMAARVHGFEEIDGFKYYTISSSLIEQWRGITENQFMEIFSGIEIGGRVDPEQAWRNFQAILLTNGRVQL
jgi:hypothetical protein